MRKIRLSAVFFCCCFLLTAQQKADLGRESKVDSVLASVNGDPITLLDVILESGHDEARLAAMFTGERLFTETAKVRKQIVDDIVIRKLIYAKYKEKPFDIKKQHIEDMVDYLASTMGDGTRKGLILKAKSYGSSLEELRERAKEKIAVDVLLMENCDRRVFITPREIYMEYKKTPEKWTIPPMLDLQLILIRGDRKKTEKTVENISKMLKDADERTFSLIAKENSEGPAAAKGGRVGRIEKDKLRPEFALAVAEAKTGAVIGPVQTPEGTYFIRIADRTQSQKLSFDKVSAQIQKALKSTELEKNRNLYKATLLKDAVVRYFF